MKKFKIIDLIRRTNIVPKYEYYITTFSWTNEKHNQVQLENIVRFLLYLKTHSFYEKKLSDYSISYITSNPILVLNDLPIHSKSDITSNLKSLINYKFKFESSFTGGSTGEPFHYLSDLKSVSSLRAFNYAIWHHFLDYNLGDRTLVISGTSLGGGGSIKKKTYNFLQSKTFFSGGIITLNEVLRFVNIVNKGSSLYIYAYPSSLMEYVRIIEQNRLIINKEKIRGIITTSEMLFDKVKYYFEEFFSTRVLNMYGAEDGGIISGSINNYDFYYNGQDCIVESVTINGNNELVLTNLNSFALPFVRYRVGDIGNVQNDSNDYPFKITNFIGRIRDFIYLGNGSMLHGVVFNSLFKLFPNVQRYQIEQYVDLSCDVRIILANETDTVFLNYLSHEMEKILVNIKFRISIVENITKLTNGKEKIIISHVS